MEWPWEWGWTWSGVGAVVGILIALGSLAVSVRSYRASARSAMASEASADAAKRAVAIQEAEHLHSKVANLEILRPYTLVQDDIMNDGVINLSRPPFHFSVKNIGGSEAFDLVPSLESDSGLQLSRNTVRKIGPLEEQAFAGSIEGRRALNAPIPIVATFHLQYRDASGAHTLEADFELIFELGKNHPASVVSVMLDGEPHHQHPATTVH